MRRYESQLAARMREEAARPTAAAPALHVRLLPPARMALANKAHPPRVSAHQSSGGRPAAKPVPGTALKSLRDRLIQRQQR